METPFRYGNPLLFRTPIWITLPSDSEVCILLKPLSYYDVTNPYEIFYMKQQDEAFSKPETLQTVLSSSILDTTNTIDFPSIPSLLEQLPKEDLKFIYDKLLSISTLSKEQSDEITDMLSVQFHPQFADDSWNCEVCQEKKLDYARGCGFLPEDKRDPAPMLPRIGERRFSTCPISSLDFHVLNKASMAHTLFIAGTLPEDGGIGAQTEWFVRVSIIYKRKLAEAERLATEDYKNKKK